MQAGQPENWLSRYPFRRSCAVPLKFIPGQAAAGFTTGVLWRTCWCVLSTVAR